MYSAINSCRKGIKGITFKNLLPGTKDPMTSRQCFALRRWPSQAQRVLHVKSYKRRSPGGGLFNEGFTRYWKMRAFVSLS